MEGTLDIQIKLAKGMLIFNGIVAIVGLFILDSPLPFTIGLLFGSIMALLNFRLLSLTLEKAIKMEPSRAQIYAGSRYTLRFVITGVVIFVSIKADHINVLGTVIGIISLKLVILATEFFHNSKLKIIQSRKEEN